MSFAYLLSIVNYLIPLGIMVMLIGAGLNRSKRRVVVAALLWLAGHYGSIVIKFAVLRAFTATQLPAIVGVINLGQMLLELGAFLMLASTILNRGASEQDDEVLGSISETGNPYEAW